MEIDYTVQVWREGGQYLAHAMPLDLASSGLTSEAARAALAEAMGLFIRTADEQGTLTEVLEEAGYRHDTQGWHSPDCNTIGPRLCVLHQPQQLEKLPQRQAYFHPPRGWWRCGWSSTQPRSGGGVRMRPPTQDRRHFAR